MLLTRAADTHTHVVRGFIFLKKKEKKKPCRDKYRISFYANVATTRFLSRWPIVHNILIRNCLEYTKHRFDVKGTKFGKLYSEESRASNSKRGKLKE